VESLRLSGALLDRGAAVTSANGLMSFSPMLPSGYTGRIQVVVKASSANGKVKDSTLRSVGNESGVFGIMEEASSGTVTITSLDNSAPPLSLNIAHGAFGAPSFAPLKGRFVAVFEGSDGQSFSRQFTKDASDYFLDFGAVPAPFDIRIQNDSNGTLLQFNSNTGEYQFTKCGSGLVLGGTDSLLKLGSIITLQHYGTDRRVLAKIDASVNKGTVSIRVFSQGTTFHHPGPKHSEQHMRVSLTKEYRIRGRDAVAFLSSYTAHADRDSIMAVGLAHAKELSTWVPS